jgi:hypothetical protein
VLGSIVMGIGVATAIKGSYGTDPLATFWEGLSNILYITVGQANILTSGILLVISWLLDKKQLNIGTIINPIIIGISTDLSLSFINNCDSVFIQITQSSIGVLLIGIGIGIYTSADIGKGSYDAVTFSISSKFQIKYFKVRMLCDSFFLITGYLLGANIGIATIIAVFCLGFIIQNTNKFIVDHIRKQKL